MVAILLPLALLPYPSLVAQPALDTGLCAHWPFEASLEDSSGAGHAFAGEAQFAGAHVGQGAVLAKPSTLSCPDAPELRLAPGLTIDCWVLFPEKTTEHQLFVMKDEEYQLRLDPTVEGGQFSFFVNVGGWEPRLSLGSPEPGRWHHLVARWTGSLMTLEVDGQKTWRARAGDPRPKGAPLTLGPMDGRLDELRIANPNLARERLMDRLAEGVAAADRSDATAWGAGGWPGWRGELGATARTEGDALAWESGSPAAVLCNPALDLDLTGRDEVTLAIDCGDADDAELVFETSEGRGVLPFPIWHEGRASIIQAGSHPNWRGHLRFLGVGFGDGAAHRGTLQGAWVADRPQGPPWVYLRSLTPGRAILRVGREEQVVAIARNLGAEARDVAVRLEAPEGVTVLDGADRSIASLSTGSIERVTWRVRADAPLATSARVTVAVAGAAERTSEVALRFDPAVDLGTLDYVPPPVPAKTPYITLMHYCPLWKEGTHAGWGKIEPWPERRPAIGWYDEGTPEVADWHIKQALEHGIQGFIYCWYRSDFSPEIHEMIGHAVHDGLLKSRYVDQFRFAIMWENANAKGVRDRDDLLENLFPYWLESFFKHPSYLKIDNKPVLVVYTPYRLTNDLGGSEQVRECFEEMRRRCREAGLGGLTILGCMEVANPVLQERMREEGYDASTAYSVSLPTKLKTSRDPDGAATIPYDKWLGEQKQTWLDKKAASSLPDVVTVMMGWDPRPWHGLQTTFYRAGVTPELFRKACEEAKRVVDATPGNGLDRRMVVFDNWNEFGEGHYLEPCAGFGFGMLDAIRDVFCEPGPHQDITPEDVGLPLPEQAYARRQAVMGLAGRQRTVRGNLLGSWGFDDDDPLFALDASGCGFHAAKRDFRSAEGHSGLGMLCEGGAVVVESDPMLFPATGLTVELWAKLAAAGQNDRWMLNCIQFPHTGYRLGLSEGRLAWQVPVTEWSHILIASEPLPAGEWVHLAATCDDHELRVYVNGKLAGQLARSGTIRPSRGDLVIGNYAPGNAATRPEGVLDEVRLYDRALPPEEVRAHAMQ